MALVKKYRRKFDGVILEAYQYGEGREFDPTAMTKAAAFVTGIDIESQTSIKTEHVMDVVQPVLADWDMSKQSAPILIARGNDKIRLELGDWIIRESNGKIDFVKKNAFYEQYEELHEVGPGRYMSMLEIQTEKLSSFIYDECMSTLDGELYQALAENIATKMIKAGWREPVA